MASVGIYVRFLGWRYHKTGKVSSFWASQRDVLANPPKIKGHENRKPCGFPPENSHFFEAKNSPTQCFNPENHHGWKTHPPPWLGGSKNSTIFFGVKLPPFQMTIGCQFSSPVDRGSVSKYQRLTKCWKVTFWRYWKYLDNSFLVPKKC